MLTKQIAFVSLIIFGMSVPCFAQKIDTKKQKISDTILPPFLISKEPRFLLKISAGYSIGLGSTFKFYPDDIRSIVVIKSANSSPEKFVNYRNPWKGLGDGFRFGGGLSYILNDFINLGLDLDYFESTISKDRDSTYRESIANAPPGQPDSYIYRERTTISYNATLITLTPNITFKAISRPKWFIYNKLGGVITFRPNSLQEDVTDISISKGFQGFTKDSTSRVIRKYDWGIKNPALGFMGAFGIQFKVAGKLRSFAELQFSHIVFVVRKRTLVDFTVNQRDLKNTLPVSFRELDFVKSFTQNVSNSSPNKPSQTLIQRIPISYVGLQLGLTYQLR